ncbi:MAG: sensor histidine kinase [Polaromonas sp.]
MPAPALEWPRLLRLACCSAALWLGWLAPVASQTSGTQVPAASTRCGAPWPLTEALRQVQGSTDDHLNTGPAPVALPDPLARALRHEHVHIQYTLDVSACLGAGAATPMALWIFRVGAPYRVDGVDATGRAQPLPLLNANQRAQTLPAGDGTVPVVYNGRIPALYALPQGTRTVRVALQTLPYMPYGLVRLEVGNTNLMLQRHSDGLREVLGYSDAASGVVTVLGMMMLLLWLRRRRDVNLLWLAVASGLWGLRGLLYFDNTVPGNPIVFEQINAINALLAAVMVTLAALHLLRGERQRQRRIIWGGTGLILLAFGLAGGLGHGALLARSAAQAWGVGLVMWLGVEMVRQRHGVATRHVLGMLACLLTVLGSALHDLLIVAGVLPATTDPYLFWGFVVVLVGFALISGEYVVMTLARAERSNEELEQRVAAKSNELARSYQQLRSTEIAAARDTARTQEREHLMREMHDGIGAQLMTALRGVERGALSREQLAASLQDGLDELRLLMDSTDTQQYLPGALAAWRNRWDARLAAAGVTLAWTMDEALDSVQLSSQAALQIMRILQEAATNVVKHSQAAHMHFSAWLQAGIEGEDGPGRVLCIDIEDNGVGPGPAPVRSGARGLKNMQHRAAHIGAQLEVGPRDGPHTGCRVRFRLPGV